MRDEPTAGVRTATCLVETLSQLFASSDEPLSPSQIRARLLPGEVSARDLVIVLERQAAAHVWHRFSQYRSGQTRYWDRSPRTHLRECLHRVLSERPLAWAELRRKLPKYVRHLAEPILEEEIRQGRLHRHPPRNARQGPRYCLHPIDARPAVRPHVEKLFRQLEQAGFTAQEIRQALERILQEDEAFFSYIP